MKAHRSIDDSSLAEHNGCRNHRLAPTTTIAFDSSGAKRVIDGPLASAALYDFKSGFEVPGQDTGVTREGHIRHLVRYQSKGAVGIHFVDRLGI